jgi:uncharacterized protein YbjT (DUF2867 family)
MSYFGKHCFDFIIDFIIGISKSLFTYTEFCYDQTKLDQGCAMNTRKALIIGATGLIGGFCLHELLNDQNYSEIIALTRKPLRMNHPKLKEVITTFQEDLEPALSSITANDIYCCLGTTIKKAGSQEAFRKIDFSLVIKVAELMKKQGAEQFVVISAIGANKDSNVFYNRIKGEMEEAAKKIGYKCLRIIRPSLLLGPREEFRLGERISIIMSPFWKLMLFGSLKKYCPVQAESVARFMVKIAHEQPISGVNVYESNLIG